MNQEEKFLSHYGTPRHSGRYPWGSGDKAYQRNVGFVSRNLELKKEGFSERERAEALGCKSINELRAKVSMANAEIQQSNVNMAYRLKEKGYTNTKIAERMQVSEGAVRQWLKPSMELKQTANEKVVSCLKDELTKTGMLDVGAGAELSLGVSKEKLKTGLESLKLEGYNVYNLSVMQMGTGKYTNMKVLANPEITWKEMYANKTNISTVGRNFIEDGGHGDVIKIRPPENISSDRVYIRYKEDGGADKDGTIELRRGVKDLDLGNSRYAQVRIGVDGSHFMKGMAFYSEDIPDGYDVIYNTNKERGASKDKVYKAQKDDPLNPFGASIKPNGQRGALNIVNEEGDWNNWSKNLAAQMLSKQPKETAKRQLSLAIKQKEQQYEEIMALTNPVVKKKLLLDFADECDSDAVHLKAAAMPRQATHVLLPVTDMKDTEIYAPKYKNGERVVLIRYPHGGKFEIPELIVNNKHATASKMLGNAKDAVGISPATAAKLSGADFDGDTALVIPNNSGAIKTQASLDRLKNFDPKEAYPPVEGMAKGWKKSSARERTEMGGISNLITDMTLKGAKPDELARAVRHSMVIIDTGKHGLNWQASYYDNNIAELKQKYQGGVNAGASTLISRSKSEKRVTKRQDRYAIDETTGEKIWFEKPEYYTNKAGKTVERQTKSTKMYEAEDARELLSKIPTAMELLYADYANHMKSMGNKSRKEYLAVQEPKRDPEAAKKYAAEVKSLDEKLRLAESNAPIERKAQVLANQLFALKKEANPDMEGDDLKKAKGQCLVRAREITGAKKIQITPTEQEWEAIQANAISKTKLSKILLNSDTDRIIELALPKEMKGLTPAKQSAARAMLDSGHTIQEVAEQYGVSTSTISDLI